MEKALQQLIERLQKAYGDRLVSVVLYGSAAAGDHHEKFSDVNILCALTQITPREMRESEDVFRWWREQGSPPPLLLTEQEVETCTDCFAIEFHDIKSAHRILYGKDIISNLTVDDAFYRPQVEHELRAKLLRLRQKASGMLSEADLLRRLLADSISTFCVLTRHALLLHGINPGSKKRDIVAAAATRFGIDSSAFDRLLDLREGKIKPRDVEPVALLAAYLTGIAAVIDVVDRLQK